MKNRIAVERIYSLGDYKNIKFTEETTEIPDEIYLNEEAISCIRNIQLLDIEIQYNRYLVLSRGDETALKNVNTFEKTRIKLYERFLSLTGKEK